MKKKIIKWLCLLIWMAIIFAFSHQPNSGQATNSILEKIFPILKGQEISELLNFIIRKLAHLTEYFILTYLVFSLTKEYKIKKNKAILISILFCIFYSITDELHQSLIDGRTATIRDCFIDTLGGIFYLLLNKIKKKS